MLRVKSHSQNWHSKIIDKCQCSFILTEHWALCRSVVCDASHQRLACQKFPHSVTFFIEPHNLFLIIGWRSKTPELPEQCDIAPYCAQNIGRTLPASRFARSAAIRLLFLWILGQVCTLHANCFQTVPCCLDPSFCLASQTNCAAGLCSWRQHAMIGRGSVWSLSDL